MEDGKWQGERGEEMAAQMDQHTTQNAAWLLPLGLRADEKKVMCFKEVKGNKGFSPHIYIFVAILTEFCG